MVGVASDALAEGGDHLLGVGERDTALAPVCGAGGGPLLVEPARGVLDEAHPPPARGGAADREVVADVGGDTEHAELVAIERVEDDRSAVDAGRVVALLLDEARWRSLDAPASQAL